MKFHCSNHVVRKGSFCDDIYISIFDSFRWYSTVFEGNNSKVFKRPLSMLGFGPLRDFPPITILVEILSSILFSILFYEIFFIIIYRRIWCEISFWKKWIFNRLKSSNHFGPRGYFGIENQRLTKKLYCPPSLRSRHFRALNSKNIMDYMLLENWRSFVPLLIRGYLCNPCDR